MSEKKITLLDEGAVGCIENLDAVDGLFDDVKMAKQLGRPVAGFGTHTQQKRKGEYKL